MGGLTQHDLQTKRQKLDPDPKVYTNAFMACANNSEDFFDSMCAECAECKRRVAHFGSAYVLEIPDEKNQLCCARCIDTANQSFQGTIIATPTFNKSHFFSWIRVNGPNFSGICGACEQELEYMEFVAINDQCSDPIEMRVSCVSCNLVRGACDFDDFKRKTFPESILDLLTIEQVDEAVFSIMSAHELTDDVLNHGRIQRFGRGKGLTQFRAIGDVVTYANSSAPFG